MTLTTAMINHLDLMRRQAEAADPETWGPHGHAATRNLNTGRALARRGLARRVMICGCREGYLLTEAGEQVARDL